MKAILHKHTWLISSLMIGVIVGLVVLSFSGQGWWAAVAAIAAGLLMLYFHPKRRFFRIALAVLAIVTVSSYIPALSVVTDWLGITLHYQSDRVALTALAALLFVLDWLENKENTEDQTGVQMEAGGDIAICDGNTIGNNNQITHIQQQTLQTGTVINIYYADGQQRQLDEQTYLEKLPRYQALETQLNDLRQHKDLLHDNLHARNQQIEQLTAEKQQIKKQVRQLLEELNNYQQSSHQSLFYQRAVQYFADGDIQAALQELSVANIEKQESDLLDSYTLRARLLALKGQFAEAESTYRKAAMRFADVPEAQFNLAFFLHDMVCKDKAAIRQYKIAVQLFRQASDDENVVRALNNLAALLDENGEFSEAKEIYQESLVIYKAQAQVNPARYSEYVATMLNNLAILLANNREVEEAESHYLEALTIYEALAQSSVHYTEDVAMTLNNLAMLLDSNGKRTEAELIYRKSLSIYEALAQTNSARYDEYVAMVLNNLANFLDNNGEFAEAKSLYCKALAIYKVQAQANPLRYNEYVATILNNLANLLQDNGEFKEAELFYRESLAIRKELASANPARHNQNLAMILNDLAGFLQKNGEVEEAESLYRKSLATYRILEQTNPARYSEYVAMVLNNLAVLLNNNGDLVEAESFYYESLAIRRELAYATPARYNEDVATTLDNFATLHKKKGEFTEAESFYRESLVIRRELAQSNPARYNESLANTALNLAIFYLQDKKNPSEARHHAQLTSEALAIYGESPQPRVQRMRETAKKILQILDSNKIN